MPSVYLLRSPLVLTSAALLVAFVGIFLRQRSSAATAEASPSNQNSPAASLRESILNRSMLASVAQSSRDAIRCVVMDWNVDGSGIATLVAFDDGTTSLYYSSGGGVIGAGTHQNVKSVAAEFRSEAAAQASRFAPTTQFDLPSAQYVTFYLVYDSTTKTSGSIAVEAVQSDQHPFFRTGNAAQMLIQQISKIKGS